MSYAAHGALTVSASARSSEDNSVEEEEEERVVDGSLISRSRSALRLPNSAPVSPARFRTNLRCFSNESRPRTLVYKSAGLASP